MFYEVDRLAEKEGATTVTKCHADTTLRNEDTNRIQQLGSRLTPHAKHVLRALALLSEEMDNPRFRTAEVYDAYEKIAVKRSRLR